MPAQGVVPDPDPPAVGPLRQGSRVSLRWSDRHMIKEYARPTGRADLLREAIDKATGE